MTLVDALRAVAPPAAAPTDAELHLRQEALAVIYAVFRFRDRRLEITDPFATLRPRR